LFVVVVFVVVFVVVVVDDDENVTTIYQVSLQTILLFENKNIILNK
jgi:hypothetical protein